MKSPRSKARRSKHDDRHRHGKTGKHRAGDKKWRKDRRVPARRIAGRKVQTDDAVHGNHQGHGECGEQQLRALAPLPVARLAAPAQRQQAVGNLPAAPARAIAQGGKVRDQSQIPKHQRQQQVGQNREKVPNQRAAPLGPQAHHVGIGRQPIEEPGPAQMDDRKHAGDHQGEDRHGLGKATDRGAPRLARQMQRRRYEGPGHGDGDPPDVVGDVKSPYHRDIQSPDANPRVEQVADRAKEDQRQHRAGRKGDHPPARRARRQHDAADLCRDRAVGVRAGQNCRCARMRRVLAPARCRRRTRQEDVRGDAAHVSRPPWHPRPGCLTARDWGCSIWPGRSCAAAC